MSPLTTFRATLVGAVIVGVVVYYVPWQWAIASIVGYSAAAGALLATAQVRSLRLHTCAHCGRRDVGSYEAGYATVGDSYLCHPNVGYRPDCYKLVTVHGHTANCRTAYCPVVKS